MGPLLFIALALAAAPDAAEPWTVVVTGQGSVAVPPLLERAFTNRVATVDVAPVLGKKDEWQLTYHRYEHRCSLVGRGPKHHIRIPAGQRCTVRVDEAKLRGTCTALLDAGSLVTDTKTGVTTLNLRARVDANVERFVSATVLGRTFQHWVPAPTPTGTARYVGRTVAN